MATSGETRSVWDWSTKRGRRGMRTCVSTRTPGGAEEARQRRLSAGGREADTVSKTAKRVVSPFLARRCCR